MDAMTASEKSNRKPLTKEMLENFINKHFNHDAHVRAYLERKEIIFFMRSTLFISRQYEPMPINPLVNIKKNLR